MTELLYLKDPKSYTTTAKIIEILETEKGLALCLNKTIFYVQGGGQPGDRGEIISSSGIFNVDKTFNDENGLVWQLGSLQSGYFAVGQEVALELDKEYRITNTKLHSAGHLLDLVVANLELEWQATRGHHFPGESYVEYKGSVDSNQTEELRLKIQTEFDRLVSLNLPIYIDTDPTKVYKDQPLRTVNIANQSLCDCGGTHVDSTGSLKNIVVNKLKSKKDTIKISYSFCD